MSGTQNSDSLSMHFSKSSDGYANFSPLLFFGKTYVLTNENERSQLQSSIEANLIYRIRNSTMLKKLPPYVIGILLILKIFGFSLIASYFALPDVNKGIVDYMMIITLFVLAMFLTFEAMYRAMMLYKSRSLTPSHDRMAYDDYLVRSVEDFSDMKEIDEFVRFLNYVLISSLLIITLSIESDRLMWFLICLFFYGVTIHFAHLIRTFYLLRTQPGGSASLSAESAAQ